MAPVKTEAIILKKNNFRETSVILSLYTEHLGKIKGLLKGVRTEKSRIPPLAFTPGAHIFALSYMKRSSELNLISSPSLIEYYDICGKENLKAWHLILNLVNLFTQEKEKDEKIFNLLKKTGKILVSSSTPEIVFVIFKLRIIKIFGYGIELSRCTICRKEEEHPFFSGKEGGIVCRKCRGREAYAVNISGRILNVMRQLERMDIEKSGIIKSIPGEILRKINFYANITLNYHTDMDKIWWANEKNLL
ncbi:MAG: DNA repair protein RecO [Candidatus Omnitrophica bacterium]|nr:DNA repair protein RecO [Candidatus Omnitrophota bacterium]